MIGLPKAGGGWRAAFLALILILLEPVRPRAEDKVQYRWEGYFEDNNRTDVTTQGVYVEKDLNPDLILKGNFVYDAISGATPTGGPPLSGSDTREATRSSSSTSGIVVMPATSKSTISRAGSPISRSSPTAGKGTTGASV